MGTIVHSFVEWIVGLLQAVVGREIVAEVEHRNAKAFEEVVDAKRQRLDATLDAFDYVNGIPVDEQDEARTRIVAAFKADLIDMNLTFNGLTSGQGKTEKARNEAIATTPFGPAFSGMNSEPGLDNAPPSKALENEPSQHKATSNGNKPRSDRTETGTSPLRRSGRRPKGGA